MFGSRLMQLTAVCTLVAGCAGQPIVLEEQAHQKFTLPYSKVFVEDFTQDRRVSLNEGVWVNGWVKLFDGTRGQSPNKTLYLYLKDSFAPGTTVGDTIKVALIDSSYEMEKNLADDMVFVNFVASLRERAYRCTASLNVSNSQKSERKNFEVVEQKSGPLDIEWLGGFTSRCRKQLVAEINSYLQTF